MPERWPDIAGRIESGVHRLPIRVYYEDTDFSGAVYHANYLKFCERARSDWLRLLGIHHHELRGEGSDGGLGFVVRRMVCDFLRPAQIDDLLLVETQLKGMGGARLELLQSVSREAKLLFNAAVTIAIVDQRGRPCRIPEAIRGALNASLAEP